MGQHVLLGIGGTFISIRIDDQSSRTTLCNFLGKFLKHDEQAHIYLEYRFGELPNLSTWEECFDSGGVWRLWRRPGEYAVSYQLSLYKSHDHFIAAMDSDFTNGVIYLSPEIGRKHLLPLSLKFLEFLTVNYLSVNRKGSMVHACAVKDGEKGRLFCGVSGAGKTTISRLWAAEENVTVLNDDRVILRRQGKDFFMYGTPWHGEAGFTSPEKVRVEQIFMLQHAEQNHERRLNPLEATASLLARSFPTFWSAKGMEFTIDFFSEVSQAVPCYELGFRPQPEVVEFVRGLN